MEESDIIYSYSRSQAIEDGVLVDIDKAEIGNGDTGLSLRKEAGIKFPIAMTSTFLAQLAPSDDEQKNGQSLTGRLWDLFSIFKYTAKTSAKKDDTMITFMIVHKITNGRGRNVKLPFKVVCGPGDDMAPVLTIMHPNED